MIPYKRYNFNNEGITYCVAGTDTYSIKDLLKKDGFWYHKLLGWHKGDITSTTLPADLELTLVPIAFDDVFIYDEIEKEIIIKAGAKEVIAEAVNASLPSDPSEYIGEIGERISHETAIYEGSFDTDRGFIHHFRIGDNKIVWFSSAFVAADDINVPVDMSFTVKAHKMYRNVKTTYITRALVYQIKEEEDKPL